MGSSPRVWGTPRSQSCLHGGRGLIPTGVGNTLNLTPRLRAHSAHPHGCGEHKPKITVDLVKQGSSPRVWGTREADLAGYRLGGLIPTGVGNTCESRSRKRDDGAHPHGCGEHVEARHSKTPTLGSSPRVWGTRNVQGVPDCPPGLIPTGVGNTRPTQTRP